MLPHPPLVVLLNLLMSMSEATSVGEQDDSVLRCIFWAWSIAYLSQTSGARISHGHTCANEPALEGSLLQKYARIAQIVWIRDSERCHDLRRKI